jgi:hypothetical protein
MEKSDGLPDRKSLPKTKILLYYCKEYAKDKIIFGDEIGLLIHTIKI